ncbi:hypothetical protein NX80_021370 [Xanthomonas vasicola pv. arecae]|nr:hypothetical protein NX80_021370 [Xanthomonas vasicola pv. arecae]TWQ19191.1 hypothetical protein FQK00_21390 [Xanthomonas vasicola]TWQ36265.1 hypothetical protein FQJ99_10540 [Xanthomonas vasicola]TWQ45723.1 hypothetical protein FQJ98_10785 [Xanthomonas vasicola]TWQ79554.1 hypothetical protein FQJ86_21390 [Xanthomonas vasicola]
MTPDFQRSAVTAGGSAPSRRVSRGMGVAVTVHPPLLTRWPGMAVPRRPGFFVGLPLLARDNPCAGTIPAAPLAC